MLRVSESGRGEYGWSYSSDDDLSSSVVDAEGQMAIFMAKSESGSRLVVLTYWTSGQGLLLLLLER